MEQGAGSREQGAGSSNVEQSSSTVLEPSTTVPPTKPPLPYAVLEGIPNWRDALGDADLLRTTDRHCRTFRCSCPERTRAISRGLSVCDTPGGFPRIEHPDGMPAARLNILVLLIEMRSIASRNTNLDQSIALL
jgi:hypothetical protein